MSLDTRTKIVSEEEAARLTGARDAVWVSGHFDPLLAAHAKLLRQRATPGTLLIAVVTNPTSPLLPLRARAELVAALSAVDYVVMRDGPPTAEDDDRIGAEFVELVLRRHQGAAV